MIIRYNWKTVLKESRGNITKILKILTALVEYKEEGQALAQRNYPKYILNCLYTKFNSSFLLNPEGLLENTHSHTNSEVFIYLELASMRNFMDFHFRDEAGVPIYYIENEYEDLGKLKLNTLLDVNDKVVRLKYEELNHG
jgi:hypothetical protein